MQTARRRSERFTSKVVPYVTLRVGATAVQGYSVDLSASGIGMRSLSRLEFKLGEVVEIAMPAALGEDLRSTARVRHSNGFRHGFEFVE